MATLTIICVPFDTYAQSRHAASPAWLSPNIADNALRALAPSQRDINIAILAVVAGNLLIGYERISRQHSSELRTARYENGSRSASLKVNDGARSGHQRKRTP
jgi:hypothetical protein